METEKSEIHINLMKISRNNTLTQEELSYFKKHVVNYPDFYSDFYRVSVKLNNFKITNSILKIGYNPNIDPTMGDYINSLVRIGNINLACLFFMNGYILSPKHEKVVFKNSTYGCYDEEDPVIQLTKDIIRQRKLLKILDRIKS